MEFKTYRVVCIYSNRMGYACQPTKERALAQVAAAWECEEYVLRAYEVKR